MRSISTTIRLSRTEGKVSCRAFAAAFALAAALLLSGCATGVKDTSRTFTTVVIDAGHGGHDNGTTSRLGGREKDNALDVALRLEPKLRSAGFHTVMTRRGDYFVPLGKRVAVSNWQSNSIFVSVHFNDTRRRDIHGTEVYYRSSCSREIARKVLHEFCALPGASPRGVRTANYYVLRHNHYPAVLVECGYMSNPSEACRCASTACREGFAEAIAAALVKQRGLNRE